jgi:hypothetical protein
MFNRVSWASAASESTANDVFILPKQWKYRILSVTCQPILAWVSFATRRSVHS